MVKHPYIYTYIHVHIYVCRALDGENVLVKSFKQTLRQVDPDKPVHEIEPLVNKMFGRRDRLVICMYVCMYVCMYIGTSTRDRAVGEQNVWQKRQVRDMYV